MQSRYYDPKVCRFLNADIVFDYDAGIQGYNLFVYCGNDPLNRIDLSGDDSYKADNGELTDDEMDSWGGGGGPLTGGIWSGLRQTLQHAADGLNMATGSHKGIQKHHVLSNKNKTYTPQYKEVTDRYYLELDPKWNVVEISDHSGRHTNAYHDFMLNGVCEVDSVAQGDVDLFLEGFEIIIDFLLENTWIMYAT